MKTQFVEIKNLGSKFFIRQPDFEATVLDVTYIRCIP